MSFPSYFIFMFCFFLSAAECGSYNGSYIVYGKIDKHFIKFIKKKNYRYTYIKCIFIIGNVYYIFGNIHLMTNPIITHVIIFESSIVQNTKACLDPQF